MNLHDPIRKRINVSDLKKQKAEVDALLNLPVEGRFWFVLDFQWWNKWCAFIEAATTRDNLDAAYDDYPGEIDNTSLLTVDGKLKPDLLREEDLTVIPEEVWNIFAKYYGCVHTDTTVFKRAAVPTPSGKWAVEIYPPHFSFLELTTMKFFFDGIYSESQTIGELKSIVRKKLNLGNGVCVRLFVRDGTAVEELSNDDVTIGEASLERKKTLYVRIDAVDGLKASHSSSNELAKSNGPYSSSTLSTSPSGNLLYQSSSTAQYKPGVCGLTNLGNTCFMNSAIQCMSNVPDLTAYFLGNWKKDINKYNPLGTHGRLATAYAELINHMWSGLYSYDVPRTFKREIASVASQFSGCAQHDSHELLVFLLDGLHEDLNRVINKPYVEVKDAGDRPDEVVAEESWMNHKARNDSIIVDCFHGQLKSTVVCPTCKYRSVTFDPFASLNLPLPEVSTYHKPVHLWPWTHAAAPVGPLRYDIPVHNVFYVRDLINSLELIRPPYAGCQYYVAEVYNHSLGRPYHPDHQIRDRYGPPVFVYELPPGELIPVRLHRPNSYNASGWVGIPFYISVPSSIQTAVDENYLIQSIVSRLRAIGITSLRGVRDSTAVHSPNKPEHRSLNSHAPIRDPSDESSDDELPDHRKSSDEAEGSIGHLLRNRIHLTDDFNQDLVAMSGGVQINLTKSERPFFRVLINCSDSALHTELEDIMKSITQSYHSSATQSDGPRDAITLSQCMEKFVSIEQLSARDLWYCRRCKEEKQATKKFDLWSLPKVLVIQLKRFRSTLRLRDKIDSLVDFPIKGLDLTPWVVRSTNERFVYDLIAVTNHMGCLYGGHYTAYALNHPTQCWFRFNDASTGEMPESQVVTNSAYVLVYRRREEAWGHSTNSSADVSVHPTSMYINDADLDNVE